jgi:hypothetical protein
MMIDRPRSPLPLIGAVLRFIGQVLIVTSIMAGLILVPGMAPAALGFLILFGAMVWFKTRGRS